MLRQRSATTQRPEATDETNASRAREVTPIARDAVSIILDAREHAEGANRRTRAFGTRRDGYLVAAAFLARPNTRPPTSSSLTPLVSGTKKNTNTSERKANAA
jgi:hypothetical protein